MSENLALKSEKRPNQPKNSPPGQLAAKTKLLWQNVTIT
jgi:hypothetical protein